MASEVQFSLRELAAAVTAAVAAAWAALKWIASRAERATEELATERRKAVGKKLSEHDAAIAELRERMATKDDLVATEQRMQDALDKTEQRMQDTITRHTNTIVQAIKARK